MTGNQFLIGLDYGTESARGVLLDLADGALIAGHREAYAHGVMVERLPDGTAFAPDWALQDPDDYLDVTAKLLRRLGENAVARSGAVCSIGIDFTASTVLPTQEDGTPLSRRHPGEPHAYVKLWKHHAAQPWAERIDAAGGEYLRYTGGQTSCEWLPAKAAQLRDEAPRLWGETARFIEAGDWLVSQLVGREVRSTCQAGYKAHYRDGEGYPSELETLIPGLSQRLLAPTAIGEAAGELTLEWVERAGLSSRPAVAVATIDAHAVVPAVGVSAPGTLVATLGTSACHLLVSPECRGIPGVAGVVRDGLLPGYWGYEAGQAGFGDLLAWFVRTFPVGRDECETYDAYTAGAAKLAPGASGVMALDWWNGCRTPLVDPQLSGLFVGMTLQTTPTELYRALLESLCFGTRRIVDTLEAGGLEVNDLVLTGGIAEKNALLLQLIADVTGREIRVPEIQEATARGAAIHGAVAAGVVADFAEAVARLGARKLRPVSPDRTLFDRYTESYALYRRLSDSLVASGVMPELRRLRADHTNS